MKKYIITGVMATVAATSAFAGTVTASKEVAPVEPPCLFRDNEIQVDAFGLGDFFKGADGTFQSNYQNQVINAINSNYGQFGINEPNVPTTQSRQLSGRPAWGGGLGLNYIFARYFGIGIEQSVFGRNSGARPVDGNGNLNPTFDPGDFGFTRWQTAAHLILRYPICQWNLAPYAMIGGGAQYGNVPNIDYGSAATSAINAEAAAAGAPPLNAPIRSNYRMSGQGFGSVGGGLEYRLTQNIGMFTDLRYLFSNVDGLANNQMQWRYGLRFAF
jgi:opacity protein-like surface antigen